MHTRNVMLAVLGVGCCALLITTIVVTSTKSEQELRSCPADYVTQPPVILVSLDGFRASYRERGLTPAISRLAQEGVFAPYMNPSYPTVTFPNHYTIVTGLYPESHGIIANKFYDPEFGATFALGSSESLEGRWWGGEPIWNTLTRQGKKSATYFWPGSDVPIGGQYPTYWYPYNSSVSYEDRVQQVLDWVMLPADERPAWITLYFDEPDHTGHAEGPDSQDVNDQLVRMNGLIEQLVTGLENAELLNCVNLIIVADHGMAGGGPGWVIKLSDYISDVYDTAYTYTGAFTRLDPKNDSDEVKYDMMRKLACQRTDMRTYERSGLPKRFHFSNNRRIEDIVLDFDDGRYGSVSSSYYNKGNHGYDNYFPAMNALFVARGPAFKSGLELAPFQNIQLYNLMCHLTGVLPAENNGTLGALNAMLNTPGPIIPLPEVEQPPAASFPSETELPDRFGVSGCPGDLTAYEDWLSLLNMTTEEQARLEFRHAPWGLPRVLNQTDGLTLLHQPDFITAYSPSLKMPLWSSFSLFEAPTGTPAFNWTSDVRLNADQSGTCVDYDRLTNATMAPLFFPGFSSDSSQSKIPYMVSNAVPSTEQQQRHWQDLMSHLIARWLGSGSLNVVVGPVFDRNADSHADVFNSTESFPQLPTVLFAIVTRCSIGGNITACEPQNLDSRAFLFPTVQPVENCLESSEYALEFSSTVRDVRIITGLAFYPDLSFDDRVGLETVVHQSLW